MTEIISFAFCLPLYIVQSIGCNRFSICHCPEEEIMFAAISLIAFKRPISPKLQHAISCGFIHWWVSSDFCTTSLN